MGKNVYTGQMLVLSIQPIPARPITATNEKTWQKSREEGPVLHE